MRINYIFGNGFSIEIDNKFQYKNLLRGFITLFKKNTGFVLPPMIEKNPEVFFAELINKKEIKQMNYQFLLIKIQSHLKEYILERMRKISPAQIRYQLDLNSDPKENKVATTNYDGNVELVFNIKFVEHFHGSITNPDKILMTAAVAKNFVTDEVKEYLKNLRGEVRIFGMNPGFDTHIWETLLQNQKIKKIVISFLNEQDKKQAEKLQNTHNKIEILSCEDFKKRYWS